MPALTRQPYTAAIITDIPQDAPINPNSGKGAIVPGTRGFVAKEGGLKITRTCKMTDELDQALQAIASQQGVAPSELMRQLIANGIAQLKK